MHTSPSDIRYMRHLENSSKMCGRLSHSVVGILLSGGTSVVVAVLLDPAASSFPSTKNDYGAMDACAFNRLRWRLIIHK